MATKKTSKKASKKTSKKPVKKSVRKTSRKSTTKTAKRTRKTSAKKAKRATKRSSKRELIAPRGDKRYVRRDEQGQFSESDDQGRSLSADIRRKAKTVVKPGQGDRGDQG
ncbi:MAG: hypothetical protein ABJA83_01990 [Burkholderiaceae bacterium]